MNEATVDLVDDLLSAHLRPAVAAQPRFKKSDRSSLLNLSSNELRHPELAELFRDFAREMARRVDLARYPVFDQRATKLCRAAGLPVGSCAIAPGSDPAIWALVEALAGTGKVITFVPCYRAYTDYTAVFGAALVGIDLRPETSAMPRLITTVRGSSPALVVLTNPDGTTGSLWPLALVTELAAEAARHGSLLLIDEAYAAFAPIDHTSLVLAHANVLVVRSYSKSHGAAGIRLAAVFARPMFVDYLLKTRVSNGVSAVALAYLDFILENQARFQKIIADIAYWRMSYEDHLRLARQDWGVAHSRANFIFLDLPSPDHAVALQMALGNAGVAVRAVAMGNASPASVRITVVEPGLMEPVMAVLSSDAP